MAMSFQLKQSKKSTNGLKENKMEKNKNVKYLMLDTTDDVGLLSVKSFLKTQMNLKQDVINMKEMMNLNQVD